MVMRLAGRLGGKVDLLSIKPPAVAGLFYPKDKTELGRSVETFLAEARKRRAPANPKPKVLISPHAGYQYSGAVAGSAFAALGKNNNSIKRVVLLGPAHRLAFHGVAVPSNAIFQTPLGNVLVDQPVIDNLREDGMVQELDRAFAQEHSLEVQLPFIQTTLPGAKVVPLLIGQVDWAEVVPLIEQLWGGDETLFVVSSDLSHYHDYDTARHRDQVTSGHIVRMDPDQISGHDACGRLPIQAVLQLARGKDMRVEQLDVRNSGDTAGPRDRVVGYGAYAVFPAAKRRLPMRHRRVLLGTAAVSIRHGLEDTEAPVAVLPDLPEALRKPGAAFVTLKLDGKLRGCVGSLRAKRPLAEDVAHNARRAAFEDPRFPALSAEEFEQVSISISVLSAPEPVNVDSEAELHRVIRPGVDGLIIRDGSRSGTFLPAVWETLPEPESFIRELKRKAGLPGDHWSSTTRVWRYTTESFE